MAQPTEVHMPQAVPVGYGAIVDRHDLVVVRPARWTFLAKQGVERVEPGRVALRLPRDAAAMSDADHLLFGLKHEGVNLPVLEAYLEHIGREPLEAMVTACVRATPTSKYVRVLWFLTEWLTGRPLPVPDLEMGNYVPVLDQEMYVTGAPRRVRRQRVIDNLLGNRAFCPFVRRTAELGSRSSAALADAMHHIVTDHDPLVIARALSFLYTKETLSSFAIERETPARDRAERFGQLLRRAADDRPFDEATLVSLQNAIVDPRFAESGFRDVQNYVGESLSLTRQRVHFIPPRPDALPELMDGWSATATQLASPLALVDPVIAAACVSYGFVFLHPFEDGNGRLHRFLVHHVLAHRALTPPGLIVPVSAVMLARRAEYDASLESFSEPLLAVVDHEIDDQGQVTVGSDSRRHYRFIDMTEPAAALYRWVDAAVRDEMPRELDFLVGFDRTRLAMRHVIDLPDRLAELFVKVVLQNGGRLSQTKRASHFDALTDDEIGRLEAIVAEHMPRRSFSSSG